MSPQRRREVEELAASLEVWRPGETRLEEFVARLRQLLGLDAVAAHRLSPAAMGWDVDFVIWSGPKTAAEARASWERGIELRSERPVVYDPVTPAPSQRNRVVLPRQRFGSAEPFAVHHLLEDFNLVGTEEIRTLVCEGSNILAWVGGWRAEPFSRRDRVVLEALIPALQHRLAMERDLGTSRLHLASLQVTLEALDGAAFIARAKGTPILANEAGRVLLERSAREIVSEIAAAVAGEAPAGRRRYRCTTIGCEGMPDHFLVMVGPALPARERRGRELGRRWALTPREQQVLALVVQGLGNKTIATELEIGLRTVELHVTRLLAKSGCDSRSAVTASFWSGD